MASDYADIDLDEAATLTVAAHPRRPTAATSRDVELDITLDEWARLLQQARGITEPAGIDDIDLPTGLNTAERLALTAWLRHADEPWPGTDDIFQPWRLHGWLLTDSNGDHWTESVEQRYTRCWGPIQAARTAILAGEHSDIDVPWPTVLAARLEYAPWGRWRVELADANRHWFAAYLLFIDHDAPRHHDDPTPQWAPPEPPTTTRGKPLATIDTDDAIATTVENLRRSKVPGNRPVGRPPSTAQTIAHMTPREKLAAACTCVDRYNVRQIDAAQAFGLRPDSLSHALRRRRRRA